MAQPSEEKKARIAMAVQRVKEGDKLRAVCRELGLARSTVYDKVTGRTPMVWYKHELSPTEESLLAKWILDCTDRAFPIRRESICHQVKKILDTEGRQTRFTDNLPGKDWYYAFLKRHPEIKPKTPQQLSKHHSHVHPGMVINWFQDLKTFLETQPIDPELWNEPERWYNGDETGFPLCPKSGKVLCPKVCTNIYQSTTSVKSVITILTCFSASGDLVSPMIVFGGVHFDYNSIETFPEASFRKSVNGWMDTELFHDWVKNVFFKHVVERNLKRPVMLLVDSHTSHCSMDVSDECLQNGIILYGLLENASHLVQPCDLSLFSSLHTAYKNSVFNWQDEHPGEVITRNSFSEVLRPAWIESARPEIAVSGFRDSGIYPWNPQKPANSPKLKTSKLCEQTKNALASLATSLSLDASPSPAAAPVPTSTQSLFAVTKFELEIETLDDPSLSPIIDHSPTPVKPPTDPGSSQAHTSDKSTRSLFPHIFPTQATSPDPQLPPDPRRPQPPLEPQPLPRVQTNPTFSLKAFSQASHIQESRLLTALDLPFGGLGWHSGFQPRLNRDLLLRLSQLIKPTPLPVPQPKPVSCADLPDPIAPVAKKARASNLMTEEGDLKLRLKRKTKSRQRRKQRESGESFDKEVD